MVQLWDLKWILCLVLGITQGLAELNLHYQLILAQAVSRSRSGNFSQNNDTRPDLIPTKKTDVARRVLLVLGASAIIGIVIAALYTCISFCQRQLRQEAEDSGISRRTGVATLTPGNIIRRTSPRRSRSRTVGRVEAVDQGSEVRRNPTPLWRRGQGISNEGFQRDLPLSEVGDSFQLDPPPSYYVVAAQQPGKTKEVVLEVSRIIASDEGCEPVQDDEYPPPYHSVVLDKEP